MRPKFILILMFITLAFLLILMISPGLWRRKVVDAAMVRGIQNPTTENKLAAQAEKDKARRAQYVICGLVVLNVIGIIVYGGLQQRKVNSSV